MRILYLICFIIVSGCVTTGDMPATKTKPVAQQTIEEINHDWNMRNKQNNALSIGEKSVVVFMRPFKTGAAVPAGLFEIENNYPQIVSFISAKGKVAHNTSPGKHVFMVTSAKGADFIEINAKPGQLYYALINLEKSKYGSTFKFIPVTLDKSNIDDASLLQKWLSETRWRAGKRISNKDLHPKSLQAVYSRYDTMFDSWKTSENRKILDKAYGSATPVIPHSKGIDTGTDDPNTKSGR